MSSEHTQSIHVYITIYIYIVYRDILNMTGNKDFLAILDDLEYYIIIYDVNDLTDFLLYMEA